MPRAFSSGALSIWSYAMNEPPCVSAETFVSAAVSVVLPWSTWPIVPTLQLGLRRGNFSLDIGHLGCSSSRAGLHDSGHRESSIGTRSRLRSGPFDLSQVRGSFR